MAQPIPASGSTKPVAASRGVGLFEDLFCPHCDYNLRGLEGNRCPECGRPFDPDRLWQSWIAWSRRQEIGLFRAYWRTSWNVVRHGRRFAHEMCRPVSFRDAQQFRLVAILHAWLPLVFLTLHAYVSNWSEAFRDPHLEGLWNAVWPVALAHVAFVVCLLAASGVTSCFFHPGRLPIRQQNRAIALSYYAMAPLALTPIVVPLFPLASLFDQWVESLACCGDKREATELLVSLVWMLAGGSTVFEAVLVWITPVLLLRRVTGRSAASTAVFALLLPILWLALAVMIVGGTALVTGFVALMVASLL